VGQEIVARISARPSLISQKFMSGTKLAGTSLTPELPAVKGFVPPGRYFLLIASSLRGTI
jgi:hypothetical protein